MPDEVNTEDKDFSDAFAQAAEAKAADTSAEEQQLENDQAAAPAIQGEEEQLLNDTSQAAAAEGEGEQQAADDPYAGLSPEAVERIKAIEDEKQALQHKIDSDNGRVAAYQRQAIEFKAKLEQQEKGQPSQEDVAAAMGSDESWDDFKTEYPDVAEAIDSRISDALGTVDKKIAPLAERVYEDDRKSVESNLDTQYPGWQDKVASTEFATWLGEQPDAVQSLAGSDAENDAASLIGYYDQHLLATGQVNTPPDDGGEKDDEVSKRRQQQLEDGQVIKGSGAGVQANKAPEGDDFSTAFQAFARRRQQQAQA